MTLAAKPIQPAIGLLGALGRSRIFTKYILLFAVVISAAVAISGVLSMWFAYREQVATLRGSLEVEARAAAAEIEQFVAQVKNQLGWVTSLPWSDPSVGEERRLDASRLLNLVPAITELALIDPQGREQLRIYRLALTVVASGIDVSLQPKFTEALAGHPYFGPVYFRRDSHPYMTISASGLRRDNGVAIAEVDLGLLWEVISAIRVGETGGAFVVDAQGRLIAHPDDSLVLRNTSFVDLPQVAAALAGNPDTNSDARRADGQPVISASATIPGLNWTVFAELPIKEALQPIYHSVGRTAGLLALGVVLAVLLATFFARRMVGPIDALRSGAERIGGGDLSHRIAVRTSDELEDLANQFNDMAGRLEAERAELERRVTERTLQLQEKSQQLALASSHKSQFLANMSHELRTPLHAILGFAELLLDDVYGPLSARTRQVVERQQANGKHLLSLINDVLDLAKIEAGQLSLSMDRFDLGVTIDAVTSALEPLAQAKGLRLSAQVDRAFRSAIGDERCIRQVLLNLVGNAIKFTDSGSVEILSRATADRFEIDVRDTGPGIPDAYREAIFQEFRQVDSSTTRTKGGTGLGLAICRRIVEQHGGRISLTSEVGSGTTFHVVLPLRESRLSARPAREGSLGRSG